MSDERLAAAAREILARASTPVEVGHHVVIREEYVLVPSRCLDWLRDAMTDEQREPRSHVVVDPTMKSGVPCLRGHRLAAEFIAERYWHLGEHLQAEILGNYEITRADVLACCFYVATLGSRTWRKRWRAWAEEQWARTGMDRETEAMHGWWSAGWADVALPPTCKQAADAAAEPPP